MMKQQSEGSVSRQRLLSRSKHKRSSSRSLRSSSKLEGIRFIKVEEGREGGSPTASVVERAFAAKPPTTKNADRNSPENNENRSPEAEYGNSNANPASKSPKKPRTISQRFYERLTQFSEIQDRMTENPPVSKENSPQLNQSATFIKQAFRRTENFGRNEPSSQKGAASPTNATLVPLGQNSQKPAKEQDNKTGGTGGISNFVTQAPEPPKMLHCCSQGRLQQPRRITQPSPKQQLYYISTVINAFLSQETNTTFMQLCRSHLICSLKQLEAAKQIQKPMQINRFQRLPAPRKLNTIVFDLDETLIHCNEKPQMPCDVLLPFVFPTGENVKLGINVRPYAQECLRQLSQLFQIIVFTASHECYGQVISSFLDPECKWIQYRYFRDSCHKTASGYIKDLRVIDRPLSNILLVDNAAFSYAFQVDNGIPIIPYYDDKTDAELKSLLSYLKPLHNCKDLRSQHCQQLRLHRFPQFSDAGELLHRVYREQLN